ncbi:Serine/threonine-protein kinase cbk1 [Cladobotryum mycophilum]|uniref:non-specific serine/threonine protein kinase n=1 Tax=Cladobotryum mycophilum TaxID=491253 RepID=A0ABR0SGJ0_9HYPO
MRPRLLSNKRSLPTLEPTTDNKLNSPSAVSFPLSMNDGENSIGPESLKLHRASSKVWSEIRGAIKAIGGNSRSSSRGSTASTTSTQATDTPSVRRKGITTRDFVKKLRLDALGLGPNTTVVLRNPPMKRRGSLHILASGTDSNSSSDSEWSSEYSGKLSAPEENSTRKTSIDSRFSGSTSAKGSPKRRHSRRSRWTRSSPEGGGLDTIQESGTDPIQPTIVTVERAAAAKIYLETHFNDLFNKPHSRATRRQFLESQLYYSPHLSLEQKETIRRSFYHQENCHLRETRNLKSQTQTRAKSRNASAFTDKYEPVKVLGKGSFGVVRLVREKCNPQHPYANQVYAMKVIRKSAMLQSSQEGHLRAERDFLVASEGSKWVVPLVASFQDLSSLYLVMEYMPGGDFLGLLIRENILHEAVARFYIAEMVLAVEEAHRLKFIHRDIKPDNFLISSSRHLKISDFGLAFDGHWSHDASYYNYHRYSLLRKLGINVLGDQKDQEINKTIQGHVENTQALTADLGRHDKPDFGKDQDLASLLGWRNRHGNRTRAHSIVGTSQYMAPEVIREEESYDGRCDW